MSANPFANDARIALRCEEILSRSSSALFERAGAMALADCVISAADCAVLIDEFGLEDKVELMRLLPQLARRTARPVISGFEVGAVGLERETGALLFGGNMEFSGTHLGLTIHGETCLAARAFSRGTRLMAIALGEAHPCGHCRQFLSEFAGSPGLRLIDRHGHDLTLAELLPWPFDPAYLGDEGAVAGRISWPELELADGISCRAELLAAGRIAHAPYTKNPAAAALLLADGRIISGAAIESVAYNPSMGPLEVAIINLVALGGKGDDVVEIHLAERRDRPVSHARRAVLLAEAFAPQARFASHFWKD
ncbi:MAG: cytidine deaminase [Pseudomonadota bacterium]|jgi:cytidine deaminase